LAGDCPLARRMIVIGQVETQLLLLPSKVSGKVSVRFRTNFKRLSR
jgi:hypothetical protein